MQPTLTSSSAPAPASALPGARRAMWLKQLHQWHWISSALCLMAMLLFSITGFTLNHAAQIEAKPQVTRLKASLPEPLRAQLAAYAEEHADAEVPLPAELADWANGAFPVDVRGKRAEWSEEDAYVALPRPGGDAWLRIAADGSAEYERTDRGWISWLNDMHKGRNTGAVWSWFIDIFAIACLVFCITGFLILKYHAANRPSTWPVIGFGILLPAVLALLFVH
ncbi:MULTISPECIES: PepSY-associated TM helix domain-containing protein [unclassified Massilia]|uniref:PepSY-associated TM helix domain-containing protein n=1 Tax=unclassified Massilia TaxID=2609279 RepID=UPI001B83AFA6|nr:MULTISPECIES: PepSY-associated TM helix domain-containing protein [unclassified Massilia]MBQ5939257.1 PepSY-associated TM helix domain-containing protein [Massilia sp. AB1]MBQ5965564.1 PepSY-associated TM helix domain-containing protein [Massilia sp. ZL223]